MTQLENTHIPLSITWLSKTTKYNEEFLDNYHKLSKHLKTDCSYVISLYNPAYYGRIDYYEIMLETYEFIDSGRNKTEVVLIINMMAGLKLEVSKTINDLDLEEYHSLLQKIK